MLDRDASYPLAIGLSILEICAVDLMDAIRGDEAFKVLSNVSGELFLLLCIIHCSFL